MIRRFLEYVEIRTKLASLLPFLLGLAYAGLAYRSFRPVNTVLFFLAMILFDMTTTALNNFLDTEKHGSPLPFSRKAGLAIIAVMLSLAAAFGIALAARTSLVVLVFGAACFLVGILYTFGPAPIASLPLGEIFSGLFMGFGIPFLTVFINTDAASLIDYRLNGPVLLLSFDLIGLLRLVLVALPAVLAIAGIMLANNICDIERDRAAGRRTLPQIIGRPMALWLFAAILYLAFADVAALAVSGILPLYTLICLAALIPVQVNIRRFFREQSKKKTFSTSIQNLLLIMLPLIVVMVVGIVAQSPA